MSGYRADLRTRVHANLNDALENGYSVLDWHPSDIVTDLRCFAEDCEDEHPDDLLDHVLTWLETKRNA